MGINAVNSLDVAISVCAVWKFPRKVRVEQDRSYLVLQAVEKTLFSIRMIP